MRGEHDLSTEPTLSRALAEAAAHSNVLVDFSECSFTDSTVIAAVIQAAQTAHACAKRLVAVIPPEQQGVFRVAEMMGIGDTLAIYRSRESGLAHLEQLMRETEHDWLLPSPPIAIDNG
jgi:anti-anti-sigma factor